MNKIPMTAVMLATAALFAGAALADDQPQTAAQKAAAAKVLTQKTTAGAEGAHDQRGTVAAEGAHDMNANTGMKATGASLNKSEGANDHQH